VESTFIFPRRAALNPSPAICEEFCFFFSFLPHDLSVIRQIFLLESSPAPCGRSSADAVGVPLSPQLVLLSPTLPGFCCARDRSYSSFSFVPFLCFKGVFVEQDYLPSVFPPDLFCRRARSRAASCLVVPTLPNLVRELNSPVPRCFCFGFLLNSSFCP